MPAKVERGGELPVLFNSEGGPGTRRMAEGKEPGRAPCVHLIRVYRKGVVVSPAWMNPVAGATAE